jgi:Predicted membrane protein/domain
VVIDTTCPFCGSPVGRTAFCRRCSALVSDRAGTVVRASRPSRFLALLLDVALIPLTLGVGWLIWWFVLAPKGQSPGDAIVGVRAINKDGTAATTGRLVLRLIVRIVLFGCWIVLLGWLDYAWALVNKDARTLHDLAARTIVVKAQGSEQIYGRLAARPLPVEAPAPSVSLSRPAPEPAAVSGVSTVRPERPIAPGSNPTEMTLRRLEFLRSQKLITEQEYQERRQTAMQTY